MPCARNLSGFVFFDAITGWRRIDSRTSRRGSAKRRNEAGMLRLRGLRANAAVLRGKGGFLQKITKDTKKDSFQ
jgi:hypothetical protein